MDFELPATKEELQNLLREIDDYYRNYKGEYEEKPLEEPVLQKLSFTPSSEESVRRAVEAEVRSRMQKEREYAAEVTRYNNQVEEKLVKGRNDKTETESTLKLRYLELTAKGLTEEQLVQLGYYKDTIRAIDGYYYTIAAQAAYDDFSKDASMNYYLGPYYDDILYKYSLRKNNG